MSKIITFRADEETEQLIVDLALSIGLESNSDAIKYVIRHFPRGREIPANLVTKDEIAGFLEIDPLSKDWSNFMDKIKKYYVYE